MSCKNQDRTNKTVQLPSNLHFIKVKLIDSLGSISIAIPNRYDTFFQFGYKPGCGLPIEKQMYKFQSKNFMVFEESGMIDTTEPKIKDQLIISHNKYSESDTTNDSVIICNYHQRRRDDIMMSPYHSIVEKDFIIKTENGFQSTFIMSVEDTAKSFFHKEIITSILQKKIIIVFDYLYVSNKKDSITTGFVKDALSSVKTIVNNNGY